MTGADEEEIHRAVAIRDLARIAQGRFSGRHDPVGAIGNAVQVRLGAPPWISEGEDGADGRRIPPQAVQHLAAKDRLGDRVGEDRGDSAEGTVIGDDAVNARQSLPRSRTGFVPRIGHGPACCDHPTQAVGHEHECGMRICVPDALQLGIQGGDGAGDALVGFGDGIGGSSRIVAVGDHRVVDAGSIRRREQDAKRTPCACRGRDLTVTVRIGVLVAAESRQEDEIEVRGGGERRR